MESELITTPEALESMCALVRSEGWLAFDTEFVGEDQHLPEVCLIQVATGGDACFLVDPLCGLDVGPFWSLIADDETLVIVHAGGEDVALCQREFGKPAARVFDLQISAGMVGYGYPTSLSRLARMTTRRKMPKTQTLTDWRRRPLTPDQVDYAIEDVAHLRAIYDKIQPKLAARSRERWAEEECEKMCQIAGGPASEALRLKRLKGAGSLSGRELAIAYALVEEREEFGKEYNRPVRTILKDHLIVEIAKRGWTSSKRIKTLRGINLGNAAVQRLAETVAKAKELPKEKWPVLPSKEDSPREEVLMALLAAVLRDYCNREDLAFSLVGKKQDLRGFIRSYTRPDDAPEEEHVYASGWRKEAVGDLLEGVLTGRNAIRVAGDGEDYALSIA